MTFENNRYGGTTVDLNLRKTEENQPTEEMIAYITKAGKWARVISYASILGLVVLGLGCLSLLVMLLKAPLLAIISLLVIGAFIYVTWLVFSITKEYANLARDLDSSADAAEDLATCFELHTRFLKLMVIVVIIAFTVGIIAALAVPAYQQYVLRARGM